MKVKNVFNELNSIKLSRFCQNFSQILTLLRYLKFHDQVPHKVPGNGLFILNYVGAIKR